MGLSLPVLTSFNETSKLPHQSKALYRCTIAAMISIDTSDCLAFEVLSKWWNKMKIQVQLTHESVSNSKGLDKFPSLDPRMTSSRLMSTVVVKQAKLLFQVFLSLERINGWIFIVALLVLKLILKTALTKLPRKSLQ